MHVWLYLWCVFLIKPIFTFLLFMLYKKGCCFAAILFDSRVSIHVNTKYRQFWILFEPNLSILSSMNQVLTQLLDTVVFTMKVHFLVDLSNLNVLCQVWTNIVNSEPYVTSFDPSTRHSGVHNESQGFSRFVNFKTFV